MADGTKITDLLLAHYPDPKIALNFTTPLELLVATILSAQCTDKRVNEVTADLFQKYKKAADYADADPSDLEADIRPTGFFRNKARSIIRCCSMLVSDYNGEVPSTMDELVRLAGVGRKTASCVLSGAFGQQAIAVDTHVIRVSSRLGLTMSKKPDVIEQDLKKAVPDDKWSPFNLALILHGRETCKARKALCGRCVLFEACEWPEKDMGRL